MTESKCSCHPSPSYAELEADRDSWRKQCDDARDMALKEAEKNAGHVMVWEEIASVLRGYGGETEEFMVKVKRLKEIEEAAAKMAEALTRASDVLDGGCTCHGYECHCDSSLKTEARSIVDAVLDIPAVKSLLSRRTEGQK